MVLIFIAPSTRYPSGGVSVIYEFASSMAQRGHRAHIYHLPFMQGDASSLEDIGWFAFGSGDIVHHFPPRGPIDPDDIPAADVIFGFRTEAELPRRSVLPVVLIQGYKMLDEKREHDAFRAPCPKICVATWLVEVGRQLGVPDAQLVHVPLGLRHEKYRLQQPIANRVPRVSWCYSPHLQKRPQVALDVLERVKSVVPEAEVVLFGAVPPEHELPAWITYRTNPSQTELVDDIYNKSRVFLCTSDVEGFGLASVEAMACGAALVTTDNGGSRDYAFHDRTALVAPTGDVDALADHVVNLLRDEDRRTRLATAGEKFVRRFDWDRSGELLDSFLESYMADPVSHGRPSEPAQ